MEPRLKFVFVVACFIVVVQMLFVYDGGVFALEEILAQGYRSRMQHEHMRRSKQVQEVEKGCEETYGLFPCSSSLPGSIFLCLMYGALLLKGANLISDGSELLLEVLDPGLIGGLLLPVLGALPDSAMIVMSGLGGTPEQAKEQVAVGGRPVSRSTIMLLSIAWGGSLVTRAGACEQEAN
eukprot:758480-Hanusia_phi.AAC.5